MQPLPQSQDVSSDPPELDLSVEPGVPSLLLQPLPFVVVGLPYKPGAREATRTARLGAETWLKVTFRATHPDHDLPYGADRGLLAWITTKAHRDGTVTFPAIRDYLRAFRLDEGGRSYAAFQERFQRIAHMAVHVRVLAGEETRERDLAILPDPNHFIPPLQIGTVIGLTEPLLRPDRYGFRIHPELCEQLRTRAIPTPLPLLRLFHQAPLAWDFTQLLLYRCFAAKRRSVIPWHGLLRQLGCEDTDDYRLKHRLKRVLEWICHLYPDCPAVFLPGLRGLEVAHWKAGQPRPPERSNSRRSPSPSERKARIRTTDRPPSRRPATSPTRTPAKKRKPECSSATPPRVYRAASEPPEVPVPYQHEDPGRTGGLRSVEEVLQAFRGPP